LIAIKPERDQPAPKTELSQQFMALKNAAARNRGILPHASEIENAIAAGSRSGFNSVARSQRWRATRRTM
jgi:hypothetical protein